MVAPLGYQIELVAQVFQVVIDWRGGQQHDLGLDPGLDDVLHQALITALLDDVAFFVAFAFDVVAEIVRFVNHHQIEVAPVDGPQAVLYFEHAETIQSSRTITPRVELLALDCINPKSPYAFRNGLFCWQQHILIAK